MQWYQASHNICTLHVYDLQCAVTKVYEINYYLLYVLYLYNISVTAGVNSNYYFLITVSSCNIFVIAIEY